MPAKAMSETPDLFADDDAEASEKWHEHKASTHVFATSDGTRNEPTEIGFDQWVNNDNWAEFRPPDTELAAGEKVSLNWGSAKGKKGETSERVADVVNNHPTLTTLHTWVHMDNPEGVFHPTHPDYAGDHSH